MKNIFKLLSLFLVVSIAVSCDSNTGDDLGYSAQEERGWVQFMDNSPSVITAYVEEGGKIELDVNVQVPNTSSDLTINYDLVSVAGPDPSTVFSNSGNVVAPAGQTSIMGPANSTGKDYTFLASITLDLEDLAGTSLAGPMVFDVVLTGTSSNQITAGLEGESFKVSQRIVIVEIASLVGTYAVDEPVLSLGAIWGESYQIEVSATSDPSTLGVVNSAGFDTYALAGSTWAFANGGVTWTDAAANANGPVVALTDYFGYNPTDVIYGYDANGDLTISFGLNTGSLVLNALDYGVVFTKM